MLNAPRRAKRLIYATRIINTMLDRSRQTTVRSFYPTIRLVIRNNFNVYRPNPTRCVPTVMTIRTSRVNGALTLTNIKRTNRRSHVDAKTLLKIRTTNRLRRKLRVFLDTHTNTLELIRRTPYSSQKIVFIPISRVNRNYLIILRRHEHNLLLGGTLLPTITLVNNRRINHTLRGTRNKSFIGSRRTLLVNRLVSLLDMKMITNTRTIYTSPLRRLRVPLSNKRVGPTTPSINVLIPTRTPRVSQTTIRRRVPIPSLGNTSTSPIRVLIRRHATLISTSSRVMRVNNISVPRLNIFSRRHTNNTKTFNRPNNTIMGLRDRKINTINNRNVISLNPNLNRTMSYKVIRRPLLKRNRRPSKPISTNMIMGVGMKYNSLSTIHGNTYNTYKRRHLTRLIVHRGARLIRLIMTRSINRNNVGKRRTTLILNRLRTVSRSPNPINSQTGPRGSIPTTPFHESGGTNLMPRVATMFTKNLINRRITRENKCQRKGEKKRIRHPSNLRALTLKIRTRAPRPIRTSRATNNNDTKVRRKTIRRSSLAFVDPTTFYIPRKHLLSLCPM